MKICFLSNFYNHHQDPISRSLFRITDGQYIFFATSALEIEQKKLGYIQYKRTFVVNYFQNEKAANTHILDSDVVILGAAEKIHINDILSSGKLIFRYSERIYKKLPKWYQMPARAIKYWFKGGRFENIYLLCASAFTSADYHRTRTFEKRAYKWGYFPETNKYDIESLLSAKEKTKILWVGRFLDWKHPDDVLKVAKRLRDDGYAFSVDIGGIGEMEQQLKTMVAEMQMQDYVNFLGAIPSDQVRGYMEQVGIYLFTSDRYEGWGAVLNESMNSGCAVVASHAIGAVPYLVKNNENGLVYHSGNVDELYEKVKYLLNNPSEQERLGKAAYETITGEWNAEVAAERLINLSKHLLAGEKYPDLYQTGPCSRAEIIKDDWIYEYE